MRWLIIPLAALMMGGKPRPQRTALKDPHGRERTEPAQEQAVNAEDEAHPNQNLGSR